MAMQRILIIDDDYDIAEFVSAAAQDLNWQCIITTNAKAFLENLSSNPTLIFLDLLIPEMDGIELLRLLSQRGCDAGIVFMSGIGKRVMETADELARALGLSVVGHLQKPFGIAELEEILYRPQNRGLTASFSPKKRIEIQDVELRKAVEQDEFVLHYQPQVDLRTGEVVGVEALIRWHHPERGLIFPDDFIPHMEALGLVDQLSWIVIRHGLAQMKQFSDQHGFTPHLSVNISIRSLLDLQFPDTLMSLAESFDVPAARITIEITESGLIKELAKTLDILTRLRMKQVQLSIDDFGTGYAMMRQLRHIPATELKIDRSFVQKMHTNDHDRVMVEKTIELGHDLGLKVVAEGVETAEQLQLLRTSSCDVVQGYHFSAPLAAEELLVWLDQYRSKVSNQKQKITSNGKS